MKNLGEIAYDAYGKSAGGVSLVTGGKLLEWPHLKPEIRAAWDAAAAAVKARLEEEADAPSKCEGCEAEATTHDVDGVPLCAACAADLADRDFDNPRPEKAP